MLLLIIWTSPTGPLFGRIGIHFYCCDLFIVCINVPIWDGNKSISLTLTHNMTQLVTEVTRAQYNSVSEKTDLSCIDHIYTNSKHKCSTPTVTSFGDSDHNIIGFIRLSRSLLNLHILYEKGLTNTLRRTNSWRIYQK